MKAIDFVVRTGMGAVQRGQVSAEQSVTTVQVTEGAEVSLNLRQVDMSAYQRMGNDLQITLADGRVVLLQNYFDSDGETARLFISADGYLNEIALVEGDGGVLYAQYGPTEQWGKWSPSDELIFLEGTELAAAGAAEEGTVSMLGAGLLGGSGLLGAAGVGAAALAGGAVLGGGGGNRIEPSVNESGLVTIGGTVEDPEITITGRADPESDVVVTIGGVTLETVSDDDGNWSVTFVGDTLPEDGSYPVVVVITEPNGDVTTLDGPDVVIDTTPPEIDFVEGTVSVGDLVNEEDHSDGVELSGTGEAGATLDITVGDVTHTVVVGEDGTWNVTFLPTEIPGGEYDVAVSIVATDSFGNSQTFTDTIRIDTIADPIVINASAVEGDGVVNAAEAEDGVTITGTSTPGATITVEIQGVSQDVVVAEDGTWSVTFDSADLPEGEYDATITASTTDAAGNSNTVTETIRIDTVGSVAIDSSDDLINAAEAAEGVTLTGTAEPGSSVEVTLGGVTHSATVAEDGSWSVSFAAGDIAAGEYDAEYTVTATDGAGNITTATRSVRVDTETNATIDTGLAGGDDLVNAAEASEGVTLTGTAEPGSSVEVTLEGVTHSATVDANGNWSVDFAAGDIAPGAYSATMTVVATDAAGNSQTVTGTLDIDTLSFVAFDDTPVEGDDVVNAAEAADGVTLTGTTQPGSSVEVTLEGVTHSATVAADGSWSVDFAAGDLPAGEYDATATVVSTSPNGNVATATDTIRVDTQGSVAISDAPVEGDDVVSADERADGVTLTGNTEPGSTVDVSLGGVTHAATVAADGSWSVNFAAADIPEGNHDLPITATATDAAGNVTTASDSLRVDTESAITFDAASVETDGIVNGVEQADGVVLTGTTEPGSTVTVRMGNATRTATVDGSGNWSATFLPTEVPTGETTAAVTATAVDGAGNMSTTTGSVQIDTFVRDFQLTGTPGGADGIVNANEAAEGLVLTGTTEPGSSVVVQLGSAQQTAIVAADGTWTASFAAGDIPAGEYAATLTATATDAAGNVQTVTDTVQIDTEAGRLSLSTAPVEGDNVVNAVEASDGVVLSGTSEPGAVVAVTFGSATHSVVTDAAGNWQALFAPSEVPADTTDATVIATTTDAAGNTRTVNGTVVVDTVVENLAVGSAPVEGDDVVNATEATDGIVLTGTTEIGSSVVVDVDGTSVIATVDAAGNWSATLPATAISAGEYNANVTVTATDLAGNVASVSDTVAVDTLVNALSMSTAPIEGDDVVNAAEAADGVTLTGQVEPGSAVSVNFQGTAHSATVDAAGNWSVDIPASSIPAGSYDANVVISATDAAGNTDSVTEIVAIDTDAPNGPAIASYTRDHTGIRGISVDSTDDALTISEVQDDGSITELDATGYDIPALGETTFGFTNTIPDGSHLVVTTEDGAGNTSGTYLVLDESTTSVVDLSNPGLGNHQIEAVDLQFAEESQLTITEAQLVALSSNSDELTVHGGADDTVTITGATATGATQQVDGETYDVYSLGDATLIIDDDIDVVI